MTAKPQMKREIGIYLASQYTHSILFYATNDAVADLEQFGEIGKPSGDYPAGMLRLRVDYRYDFEEVVHYMENYK